VRKPQWITVGIGLVLTICLYLFGKTVPEKKPPVQTENQQDAVSSLTIDSILYRAKESLRPEQVARLNGLEKSVVRGDINAQQLKVYHQLAHFWKDSAGVFEAYAWYEGEAARLENSEKSLTFAARLFLDNLRGEDSLELKRWEALQAKDLFERSLKINPNNDSSIVGLGACYIFGGISAMPMEGILKVKGVADRDSTNIYAQTVLGYASLMSGQTDKAISRFQTVVRLQPANLEGIMILADLYEKKGDKTAAIGLYEKAIPLIKNEQFKSEVSKRIGGLKK
jgi:tetratricopeptide (TPR) repeat protein